MVTERSAEEEILDAAYTVLVERGFDGFTTQAIAEEAGRNQSLVHYYFDTKRDLVLALFEHLHTYVDAQLEELADEDDPEAHLSAVAEYFVWTAAEANGRPAEALAYKRAMLELRAQAPYDAALRDAVAFENEHLRTYVADLVREGIERGAFRDVDPDAFAAVFLAAVEGAHNWNAVFGDEADDDLVLEGIQTFLVEPVVR